MEMIDSFENILSPWNLEYGTEFTEEVVCVCDENWLVGPC